MFNEVLEVGGQGNLDVLAVDREPRRHRPRRLRARLVDFDLRVRLESNGFRERELQVEVAPREVRVRGRRVAQPQPGNTTLHNMRVAFPGFFRVPKETRTKRFKH